MNASRLTPHASPSAPVITIDGPSASGKGTVAARVAQRLGFHYLDSGALYRVLAVAARRRGVSLEDESGLADLASRIEVGFQGGEAMLDGTAVGDDMRTETAGDGASRVAALPAVRAALLDRQRAFRRPPGLVTDGRDMGSVVFPDATLKVFLTASAEERAVRRYKQLIEKGFDANLARLTQELRDRDARDANRPVAPLRQGEGAELLDTTALSIEQAVERVLDWYRERVAPRVPEA